MLILTRHAATPAIHDAAVAFLDLVRQEPGFVHGKIAYAVDAADMLVISEWDEAGSYRRALSAFHIRPVAYALFETTDSEVTSFEVTVDVTADAVRNYPRYRADG